MKFQSCRRSGSKRIQGLLVGLVLGCSVPAWGLTTNVVMTFTNIAAGETVAATNGNLVVLAGGVTNAGTLLAGSGGLLEVYGTAVNRGTVSAVDGVVRFHGPISNEGTYAGTNIFRVGRVPQLYFQNDAGTVARWTLDRYGLLQYAQRVGNMPDWKLVAAADVDADGITDLIWQTRDGHVALWFMDENFVARSARIVGEAGSWDVRACGSASAAWGSALFFQHADGATAIWNLGYDGAFRTADYLGPRDDWRLCALAPRSSGALPDLLWQNPHGDVAAWTCDTNNNNAVRPQWLANTGAWQLRGSVDIDGDGTADLIWQTPHQHVAGWLMDTNGHPRDTHYWTQTRGWQLRTAGDGRLVYPLNPAVPPDTNDVIALANQWLATGGTLCLAAGTSNGDVSNRVITLGNASVTQNLTTAFGGFSSLLNQLPPAPINGTGGGATGYSTGGNGTLTFGGGGNVYSSGGNLTMGSSHPTVTFTGGGTLIVTSHPPATLLINSNATLNLSGGLFLAGGNVQFPTNSGIVAFSNNFVLTGGINLENLNNQTLVVGSNRIDLATVLTGGNGILTWLNLGARLYTNNVLLTTVTLQLTTNEFTGEITGTLNPAGENLALGAMSVTNLFTLGTNTFSAASPLACPTLIYTNGVLSLPDPGATNNPAGP